MTYHIDSRRHPEVALEGSFHRLDALDELGVFRPVLVPHRLHRVLERLLVGDLDDLDAGRLGLFQRLLLILVPQYTLLGLRLAAEFLQELAILGGERVPGLAREHQDLGDDQVLGQRVVFGDLIVIVEHEARRIVLGAVDDAGLQRAEDLIVSHGDAIAAERVHHVDEHRIAHDAHLEALEIVDAVDGPARVVDAARARIHPADADQPGSRIAGHLFEQLVSDRAVDHLLQVRGVAEQERQVEDVEIVDHRPERADADPRELNGADLGLLDRFLLAAELHRAVHLHAQPSRGRVLELAAEAFHRRDGRITGRVHVGGLEHQLLLRERRADGSGRDRSERQGKKPHCFPAAERQRSSHGFLLGFRGLGPWARAGCDCYILIYHRGTDPLRPWTCLVSLARSVPRPVHPTGSVRPGRGETAAKMLYRRLKAEIVSMQRKPGEAIMRLADEALVDIFPQSGTFVARIPLASLPEAILVRKALEQLTARLAAEAASAEQLSELYGLIERQRRMQRAGNRDCFHEADEAFHAAIAESAGHPGIWTLIQQVKIQVDRYRRLTLPVPGRMARVLQEHAAIAKAIEARDPARAAAAMAVHLDGLSASIADVRDLNPEYFVEDLRPALGES